MSDAPPPLPGAVEGREGGLRIAPGWLSHPGIRAVLAALTAEGARARFVGGCVRNALLGPEAPAGTDIDVAIDRPPEESLRLLEAAGLKAIPTGFDHGTVTALAPRRSAGLDVDATRDRSLPIEVTSLRRDVETDGRRAVVAYTDDWAEDACRRDFTMNALYADADGLVFDPLGGGIADLRARRLRFIGAAEDRIREDYLRILRYYRFFAWYGAAGGLDARDFAATADLVAGLDGLARERVGSELKKLFAAPDPAAAAEAMARSGALARVLPGLDASPHAVAARLARLGAVEATAALPPRWSRRVAALLGDGRGADLAPDHLIEALRLSKSESAALVDLGRATTLPPGEAGYRLGAAAAQDAAALSAASLGGAIPPETLAAIRQGAEAVLPIAAKDLIAAGFKPGPRLGAALRAAERDWIAGGFDPDPAELIARSRAAVGLSDDGED